MDKRQFVENMIERVRDIPLSSIIGNYVSFPKILGRNHFGHCPFHNDNRIGSFVVTNGKQIWKCFSCGVGGDASKFLSLLEGKNYLEASFELALQYGIINSSDYDAYFKSRRYKKEEITRIERHYQELDKRKWENNIADPDTLHVVFSTMRQVAGLSDEHRSYLMKERGLSEREIEEGGYFTFPTKHKLFAIKSQVVKSCGSEDVFERIPGFFKHVDTGLYDFARHRGIGICIQNAQGKVVGVQIRHDDKGKHDSRYVWFSSSFAMYDGERYDCGTSSGSPIDVVYPEKITNPTVIITEGRFKAQAIAKATGSIAISVQGVSTWAGIAKELERIPNSDIAKARYGKPLVIRNLLVAFDADLSAKFQVFGQLKSMTDNLQKKGYVVYYLHWDMEIGKGIDDVLLIGRKDAIKRYDKKEWDEAYDVMVQKLLQTEPYQHLKDVPEELMLQYFKKEMNVNPIVKKHSSKPQSA